ncbi:hypothetical protein [Enterococcus casseliflavus]
MLINEEMFDKVTDFLVERGTIQEFESKNGKLKGRMMITLGELPEDLGIEIDPEKKAYVFNGSFDFYDAIVGVALYLDSLELASGVWVTPQKDDAEEPAKEWIEFFIQTLVSHIDEDGGFGIPMYTYVNDTSDFTVVPGSPE